MTDPSVTEQEAKRAECVADVRAFADWLEQNPWLPQPTSINTDVHLNGTDDANPRVALDQLRELAQRAEAEVDESLTDRTRAKVNIGLIEYKLLAWHMSGRPGEPDERDAELERLRAEVAALRSADYGHDRIDHGDATTPVPANVDGHAEFTGRAAACRYPECECDSDFPCRPDSATTSPAADS